MITSKSAGQEIERTGKSRTWPTRSPSFSISIKYRLPLMMAGLLIGMIAVYTLAAYRGVKESALEVGRERLRNVTRQLASLSQQSTAVLLGKTLTAANDPAIRAFLQSPSAITRSPALSILQQFNVAQDPSSLQIELWSGSHSLVLTQPEGAAAAGGLESEFSKCSADPFRIGGAIRIINGTPAYPAVAAVKDDSGKPIGYLVRWRRVIATPEARKQMADLLGSEAALYLGNTQGDVWTDLAKVVPKPPVGLPAADVSHYTRDGISVMAMGQPINGSPWSLVVEFPDRAFLTHAGAFLRRMIVIGLLLLLLCLAGAFALSRSITRPLHTLTLAASGIRDGDYSHFVDIRTFDELGVLSRAFNVMTARVRDSQRELEYQVSQRTAQLLTVNKELEAFSYSVSHDLRAPLRHINGFSQALLEDHGHHLDDVGKGYLRELRGASLEMAQLIDDVLQLARITRSEMRREPVDLSDLAHAVTAELQKGDPGHAVIVNIEEGLSTQGDRRLLQIMLSNLLGNAWKFTSKRELAEITFGQEQKDGERIYFIRDNGAGFDMAHTDRLFRAFQRLHSNSEFEGTGIGLATVQRIVHRHGGNVWAEGIVNQGATFYFVLASFQEVSNGEQGDFAG